MFFYQPLLNTLELKKDKATNYVLSWKSKVVYASKLKHLCTAFLYSIKFSGCKLKIKFDKDPLAVEQNNYTTKIVNAYKLSVNFSKAETKFCLSLCYNGDISYLFVNRNKIFEV